MATFVAAAVIVGGMAYWHRASGQPANATPDVSMPSAVNTVDDPSSRPRSATRNMSALNKVHRVGGELKVSDKNVANSPYSKSVFAIDQDLEAQAAKIVHAPTIDELLNR